MIRYYVKYGLKKQLETIFGCSHSTVNNALRGITDSEQARAIREYAVNKLGAKKIRI